MRCSCDRWCCMPRRSLLAPACGESCTSCLVLKCYRTDWPGEGGAPPSLAGHKQPFASERSRVGQEPAPASVCRLSAMQFAWQDPPDERTAAWTSNAPASVGVHRSGGTTITKGCAGLAFHESIARCAHACRFGILGMVDPELACGTRCSPPVFWYGGSRFRRRLVRVRLAAHARLQRLSGAHLCLSRHQPSLCFRRRDPPQDNARC